MTSATFYRNCEKNNGKGPCSHTCSTVGTKEVCSCPPGLQLGADKKTCAKNCEKNNGKGPCSHTCSTVGTKEVCSCPSGYYDKSFWKLGKNKKDCVKVHVCETNKGKGPCSHICKRNLQFAQCDCPAGLGLLVDKITCTKIPSGVVQKEDQYYYKYFS